MIIAIYDHKVRGVSEVVKVVNCRKVTPVLYQELKFPCTDTTLEFIYVGY